MDSVCKGLACSCISESVGVIVLVVVTSLIKVLAQLCSADDQTFLVLQHLFYFTEVTVSLGPVKAVGTVSIYLSKTSANQRGDTEPSDWSS